MVDGTEFILTAGNDQKIRYWDMSSPKNCSLIVPAPKEKLNPSDITYESRLIDGTEVIRENVNSSAYHTSPGSGSGNSGTTGSNRINGEEPPRSGPELPAPGHHDIITDLIACRTQKQMFFASCSRDGVVKLWK